MNKISQYFSTLELTRGFFIALLASTFIYIEYWGFSHPFITTFLGLLALYLLLDANQRVWFWTGAFTGLFWFWWITVSFRHYEMLWAIPIAIFFISFTYGLLFWIIAWLSKKISSHMNPYSPLITLTIKAAGLLLLSYIHPFGFDWFKPELVFVNSYLGIEKWQFAIILTAILLAQWKKQLLFLFLVIFAYQPSSSELPNIPNSMDLISMHTSVEEKWDKSLHKKQFYEIFQRIDKAIEAKKRLIVLPESVFPIFLNYETNTIDILEKKAKNISIVAGGLYWDGKTPLNSTYIFTDGKINIANKVLLVPFGESNPLPDFLSDWVNKVFYDGAVDYKASENVVDYVIDGIIYRNAICFEATSEKIYEKNAQGKRPERMIILSNNGWFTPSIEPTLQRLLLQYYSKKYGTTMYHSINMSPSYTIVQGKIFTSSN